MKSAETPRKQMYFKLDKTQQKFFHSGEILLMEEEKRLKLYLSETLLMVNLGQKTAVFGAYTKSKKKPTKI